jgi:capsular polysaccharide biosynthesis protein
VHTEELVEAAWEIWARNSSEFQIYPDVIVVPSKPMYFHWLIEQIPGVLRSMKHSPDAKVLIASDAPTWMFNACLEMNINVTRHPHGAVKAKRYTTAIAQNQTPLREDLDLIRGRFNLLNGDEGGRKIMVSRRFSSRYTQVESELEEVLVTRGYQIVYPERLSLSEQVKLFSSASTVVGATGSAMSNVVWMGEGSRVVALTAPNASSKFFLWNRLNPKVTSYWQIDIASLTGKQVIEAVLRVVE